MKPAYMKLCTEYYDLTKPEADIKEVNFYENLLKTSKGPILEAMCGSGRLLIPLLKKGLVLEGVDNSSSMLQSCKKRCSDQNLSIQLYNQSLNNLHLPKKFGLIFIAIGSFQLISDRIEALQILKQLRSSLLPKGTLVIETFVPWDSIRDNINETILADKSKTMSFEKTAKGTGNSKIIHKSFVTTYFNEQLENTKSFYEKWIGEKHVQSEEEEYNVRWYYRFEMQLLLEKAGFSNIIIKDESFELNEQAVIYVASN